MTPEQLAKAGTEHAHQCAVFCWRAQQVLNGRIELGLLYSIKNAGHGDAIRGARSKAEGVTPGIPDICLPVSCRGYHALYIELKKPGKSKVDAKQIEMHTHLRLVGNKVEVCVGWRATVDAIDAYMGFR